MPKIRRAELPEAVLRHLAKRVYERRINTQQLGEFSDWLATDPTVPEGRWFKAFSNFFICGEGELIKTFLLPGQVPDGEQID